MEQKPEIAERAEADEAFLYRLYCDARADEAELFGWEPSQIEMFFRMQYSAREDAYRRRFPGAVNRIVFADGRPVGRLLVEMAHDRVTIIDIVILREFRRRGIAAEVLSELLAEADAADHAVELRVDADNVAAIQLYSKLGFVELARSEIMISMRRDPHGHLV